MISESYHHFDLKTDSGFKTFFGSPCRESEYCLKRFLSALTRQKISCLNVSNGDPGNRLPLGISCLFENGKKADFEIQVVNTSDSIYKRADFYTAKVCASVMASGVHFQNTPSLYRIFITDFSSFSGNEFYKEFVFSDPKTNTLLTDSLRIIFIELPKLSGFYGNSQALNELEFWSMLIKDSRYMLASGTKAFSKEKEMAETILTYISRE